MQKNWLFFDLPCIQETHMRRAKEERIKCQVPYWSWQGSITLLCVVFTMIHLPGERWISVWQERRDKGWVSKTIRVVNWCRNLAYCVFGKCSSLIWVVVGVSDELYVHYLLNYLTKLKLDSACPDQFLICLLRCK